MSKLSGLGLVVVVASLLSSTPAWAQVPTAPPAKVVDQSPADPPTSLTISYAYMHDFSWKEHYFYGWAATLSRRVSKNVSIVGEAGGSYGHVKDSGFTIQRYAFLGGLKLSGGEGQVRPFFQVLSGLSRQGGDVGIANGVAIQPGGGADITLNDRITLRAQGDFRWFREWDVDGQKNWTAYRVSGGMVIFLGKKR